jgi:trans-2,3-dihydro-3-hydroxyanthranilate isomerase
MSLSYLTLDVFTGRRFSGNQLGVILDGTGLSVDEMLAITREFNYSETIFFLPPSDPANAARVRIFTPGGELPFAGHPTVGAAVALAYTGRVALTGEQTRIVLEEGVGPVPVTIRRPRRPGGAMFAQFSVAKLPEMSPAPADRDVLADILSLRAADLLDGEYQPEVVSCGVPFLFVPLRDRDAVRRARIRMEPWERTLKDTRGANVMIFAPEAEEPGHDLRARMYGPGVAVAEDPATGSACAGLAGYLAARTPRDGTLRWVTEQGYEMGRPSVLELEADKSGGAITAVRVGGEAVVVCRGELLP